MDSSMQLDQIKNRRLEIGSGRLFYYDLFNDVNHYLK